MLPSFQLPIVLQHAPLIRHQCLSPVLGFFRETDMQRDMSYEELTPVLHEPEHAIIGHPKSGTGGKPMEEIRGQA